MVDSIDGPFMNEYFALRESATREILRLPDFEYPIEEYDKNAEFVLIIEDGSCVAGTRLLFSHPGRRPELPVDEVGSQPVMKALSFLNEESHFFEYGGLFVVPRIRNRQPYLNAMVEKSIELGKQRACDFLVSATTTFLARMSKPMFTSMGYELQIYDDLQCVCKRYGRYPLLTVSVDLRDNMVNRQSA
ncbi:MAG: hypothetical protein CMO81_02480 [Waddliaceae bacterium]|nr:hypothetical protein [Waddliaceae bacterium]